MSLFFDDGFWLGWTRYDAFEWIPVYAEPGFSTERVESERRQGAPLSDLPNGDDVDRAEFPKEGKRISRRITVEIANCEHLTSLVLSREVYRSTHYHG